MTVAFLSENTNNYLILGINTTKKKSSEKHKDSITVPVFNAVHLYQFH